MASNCFVPYCTTKRKNKNLTPNAKQQYTYSRKHEFPCNNALYEDWILAIGRIDPKTKKHLLPKDTDWVCTDHFTPDQYSVATGNRKRLLPTAVPCIFPGYPDYMLDINSKYKRFASLESANKSNYESKTVAPCKRKSVVVNKSKPVVVANKSKQQITSNPNIVKIAQQTNDQSNTLQNGSEISEQSVQDNSSDASTVENTILNDETDVQSFDFNQNRLVVEKYSEINPINNVMHVFNNTRDKSNNLINQSNFPDLAAAETLNHKYKSKILKLEEENKELKLKNEQMAKKIKVYNIEGLEKCAGLKDPKACFALDQVCNFEKEAIFWSHTTAEFAALFEKKFPEAYTFLNQTDIIGLPWTKTLGHMNPEIVKDFEIKETL